MLPLEGQSTLLGDGVKEIQCLSTFQVNVDLRKAGGPESPRSRDLLSGCASHAPALVVCLVLFGSGLWMRALKCWLNERG